MSDYLILSHSLSAAADKRMCGSMTKNLWNSFCLTRGRLELEPGEDCVFRFGDVSIPQLEEGSEYALTVSETGAAVAGADFGGLMRGFIALLMKIECLRDGFRIRTVTEQSHYLIKNRMIHICVFPENDLYFIKKLIRLAGLCQYTHIVIEFWGMLKYDCMKELAWPNAFTKEQARELVDECRLLGMEPIPMFNQLGHATASRNCYGKHVVLDQNPCYEYLFTPDGWAWNIESEEVFALLKAVRKELYDVFGEGSYMHIGCDEAYYYSHDDDRRKNLPAYLKALTEEVEKEGRRPMLWMDMLLERDAFQDCYSAGFKDEVEQIRSATARSSVFVDWQYGCKLNPIPSLVSLKDSGHDCIGAPWEHEQNYTAHIQTVADHGLFGIMLTTWHTLKQRMPSILGCAKKCGMATFPWGRYSGDSEHTATLRRRVSFEGNTYADCGWSKEQIET